MIELHADHVDDVTGVDTKDVPEITKPDIEIPTEFRDGVLTERGAAGVPWLAQLPARVHEYCQRWNLCIDGPVMHGYIALVVPVTHHGEPCVLKLSWVDDETIHEAAALTMWAGNGSVRLLDADVDAGVLLLERLDASRNLTTVDIDQAVVVAAQLLRRLAVPATNHFPSLQHYADKKAHTIRKDWARHGRPFPDNYLCLIESLCQQLASSTSNSLVHWDLHYENILSGEREPWLAIDPKVSVGDVEFGVAQLLWNRFDQASLADRFQTLVQTAALDDERARAWTIVRSADYWLWTLGARLTHEPAKCRVILEWLLG